MEIHAPDEPVHSWKEVIRHLTIITGGVLIALAFEGVVSWADHRLLVREAEANLRREIADNAKELDGLFANLAQESKNLEHADEIAQMLLDHKKLEHQSLTLEFHGADLKNASRTTAEITGAFGHMDYADVKKYASVYSLQDRFNRAQERENESFVSTLSGVRFLQEGSEKADAQAIKQWRTQIDAARAALFVEEQIGRQLQKRYKEVLEGR